MHPLDVFRQYAHGKGFTVKVVGDYAYKKSNRTDSPTMKFTGMTKDGQLSITEKYRNRIERYTISEETK